MKLHFMPNSFFASCIMSAEPQTTIGEYFKPILEREKTANFLGKKSCLHNSQEQVSHDESRTVIFFCYFKIFVTVLKKEEYVVIFKSDFTFSNLFLKEARMNGF
jgi:hypothetical protein